MFRAQGFREGVEDVQWNESFGEIISSDFNFPRNALKDMHQTNRGTENGGKKLRTTVHSLRDKNIWQ
jgi:hypothetical protein